MIGIDTTFLVHLEIQESEAHAAAMDLGRKRLLDTTLAATYYANGITTIATSNTRDYRGFGVFDLVEIR